MKQEKQDRRSRRTRDLVIGALMDLMLEKSYDAITVQDLLDQANIGRSTFYSHYYDKEDVLTSLGEQMLEMLGQLSQRNASERKLIPSLELFEHASQNRPYFRAMMRGRAREVVWDTAQASLSKSIEQSLVPALTSNPQFSVPPSIISQYLAGAFLNLLKWWLENDMPYTPEQMDAMFQQLALPGVRAVVGEYPTGGAASGPFK